ncbi:MAG: hypothetical protein AAF583_01445 [Pseudomonadota bacterium]
MSLTREEIEQIKAFCAPDKPPATIPHETAHALCDLALSALDAQEDRPQPMESGEDIKEFFGGLILVSIDAEDGIGYAIKTDGKYVPGEVDIEFPEDMRKALPLPTEGGS